MTMAATTGVVAGQITLQQVMEHGSEDDCWSAVYGIVYDLTAFAPEHTFGKPKQVYRMCGQDGTSQYDAAHGKHPEYLDMFPSIQILGDLVEEEEYIMTDKPTEPPTDPLTETAQAAEEASLLELANATMVNATNATIHFTLPGVFGNTTQDVISIGELQSHDTTDDCWVVSVLYPRKQVTTRLVAVHRSRHLACFAGTADRCIMV